MRPLRSLDINRQLSFHRFRYSRFFDLARSQLLRRGGGDRKNRGRRIPSERSVAQNVLSSTKSSMKSDEPRNVESPSQNDSSPISWRRVILNRDVAVDYPVAPQPTAVWKLNTFLKRGLYKPTDDTTRKNLWKSYKKVKELHPDAFRFMPDDAWNVLWVSQSHISPSNDNRMAHLKELASHQEKFGSSKLRRVYLDTLFTSGAKEEAASGWIKMYSSSPDPVVVQPEFLAHGIKMTAGAGMFEYAQLILMSLDDSDTKWFLGACKDIFKALRELKPKDIERAWNWYVEVQLKLGDSMPDSDYELFWMEFLRANETKKAQKVFKDMLRSSKFILNFQKDKTKFHQQITALAKAAKSVDEVHQMFWPLLNTKPALFNKGLFFNTWLQKLLDLHNVSAALIVVELAYELNCIPAPRMMDRILSTWVGAQPANPRDIEIAKEIALRMVAQRLEEVRRRKPDQPANTDASKRHKNSTKPARYNRRERSSIWKTRPVPPATSATFSVLLKLQLQQHKKDGLTDKSKAELEGLLDTLRKCKLPVDPEGLSILLQYYLRNHNLRMVQATLMDFVENGAASAWLNESSIAILWNACYISMRRRGSDFTRNKDRVKLRPANVMQHTLSSFKHRWRGRVRTVKKMSLSPRMSHMMIKCFCGERDYAGVLLALRVLAHRFGIFPSPKTIEIIAGSVASIAFRTRSPSQRRLVTNSPLYRADMAQLIKIMSQMFNMRVQSELDRGLKLDDARRTHLMLETLIKFLHITMLREQSPKEIEERISHLRKQWGVEDCPTGDSTAFEVYVELYVGDALRDDHGSGQEALPEHKAEPGKEAEAEQDVDPEQKVEVEQGTEPEQEPEPYQESGHERGPAD